MINIRRQLVAILLSLLIAGPVFANQLPHQAQWSNVAINGQRLTVQQLHALEVSLQSRIPAGVYVVDARGCWANLTLGTSGCIQSLSTFSRYGSGERTSDGSWNHWSNSAGMGVGGTSDGCIYTTVGWSNC